MARVFSIDKARPRMKVLPPLELYSSLVFIRFLFFVCPFERPALSCGAIIETARACQRDKKTYEMLTQQQFGQADTLEWVGTKTFILAL